MTNYERAAAALQHIVPDRVPIFELMIDPRVIEAACPGCCYGDFVEKYDIDIVMTGTPSSNYRTSVLDEKTGTFRDEWGVVRRFTEQTVPFPIQAPLQNDSDIESYIPPDPLDPLRFQQLQDLLKRFKGKKMVGMHVHDALSYPSYLRRMDQLMMDLMLHPELVKRLIDMSLDHTIALMRKARVLGAELFVFGDDYCGNAGPLMSPKHFEQFFTPGLHELGVCRT